MPRKERTNAKTWERDRRNRMNSYFKTLSDLLPPHQEGRTRNKVDILIHASKYIKDLTNRTEELFFTHAVDAHKEELSRLKKLVAQLYSRTQLLSTLLNDAGITIPSEPALEKMSPLKWSNKINVEDAEKHLAKKPERRKSKSMEKKVPPKKKPKSTPTPKKSTTEKEASESINVPSEDQENHINSSTNQDEKAHHDGDNDDDNDEDNDEEEAVNTSELRMSSAQISNNDSGSSQDVTKKSGTKILKLNSKKKIKRKGKVIEVKNKAKQIFEPPLQSHSIGNLMSGTLILSGGKIMPLISPLTSNILVNTSSQAGNPIILGNAQPNPMIVMQPLTNRIQNKNGIKAMQKVTLNTCPSIRANIGLNSQDWVSNVKTIIEATKIGGRKGILPKGKEITKTTMTYKVPIPAVHRESNTCKSTGNNSNEKKEVKIKVKKVLANKKAQGKGKKKEGIGGCDMKNTSDATTIEENSRKRMITRGDDADSPPTKIIKSSLPETCISIENMRHVIEKIGDGESFSAPEKPNNGNTSDPVFPENKDDCLQKSPEKKENKEDTTKFETQKSQTNNFALVELKSSDDSPANQEDEPERKSCVMDSKDETLSTSAPQLSEVEKVISESEEDMDKTKEVCSLGTRFDGLLNPEVRNEPEITENDPTVTESAKILLNLDTNTTTTMKSDAELCPTSESIITKIPCVLAVPHDSLNEQISKIEDKTKDITPKTLSYSSGNSFVPIGSRSEALHSDLSNDLFASLQVPSSSHNPESISPTAAFLMAFPLVSSLNGKTEVLEEDMKEDLKYHSQTPPMLLQIGALEPNSFRAKSTEEKCIQEKEVSKPSVCQAETKVSSETPTTKVLPKIINNETIKERLYKVVPYSEPAISSMVNTFTNSATVTTINSNLSNITSSHSVSSFSSGISATHQDTQIRKVTSNPLDNISNLPTVTSTKCEDDQSRKCPQKSSAPICPVTSKFESNPIPSSMAVIASSSSSMNELQKYNTNPPMRYPPLPEFVPNYSNFASSSQNQIMSSSNSTMSYPTSQAAMNQSIYPVYGTQRDPQIFTNRTTDNTIAKNQQILTYTMAQSRPIISAPEHPEYSQNLNPGLPTSSEGLQYKYGSRPKDYPIQVSQEQQRPYIDHQKGNLLGPMPLHSSQSTYAMHVKENSSQMAYQEYSIGQNKNNVTTHDSNTSQLSRTYIAPRSVETQSSNLNVKDVSAVQNSYQGYLPIVQNKEPINQRTNEVQSSQNLGQSYPNQVKQTSSIDTFENDYGSRKDGFSTSSGDQRGKLPPKSQSQQDNQRVETLSTAPATKIPTNNFGNPSNVIIPDNLFHGKRNETQSYAPYVREQKKMFENPSNTQITKSNVQTPSLSRYPHQHQQQQHQETCVATSNYGQSTVTDNLGKATTTVAHNSSNFSILSWTTFSPIGGGNNNNNLVQFEPGAEHVDETEGKTICENFSYAPLHKENVPFGNIMSSEPFNTDTTIPGVDKSKTKLPHEKQNFEDSAKMKNIQVIPTQQKPSRSHNQNAPIISNNFKYTTEKQNKSKYPMDSTYTQTEFGTLDQRHQHPPKSHIIPPSKPEKTNYSIPGYDSQVTFDITESVPQPNKCTTDIYSGTNYKYGDEKDPHAQIKYQPIIQSQPPVLHQQQQQQQNLNKSKPVAQQQVQQTVRPPVNWMMTPEVKHNTNISDLILPPIGKELEFCQNNIFSQTPSYNQSTPNQFYNNYDASVSASHTFPNVSTLQSDSRRIADGFYSEDQPFSWSPTKNSVPQSTDHTKSMDQHVVPSTLPTLVGDLALGTNIPEKQSFLFGQMPPRSSNEIPKVSVKEKESNVVSRDYQVMLNSQTAQHSGQGTSFLSVSQLVEHEKAEKSQHQQALHPLHHQTQVAQTSQATPQPRKHQRKSNTSPRTTGKRQMDMRKASGDQQMQQQHTEGQKVSSSHVFPDQPYQQQPQQPQKYQQNDILWRNRNCKSNYTAEALIGVNNTSVHDANHPEKQLHAPAIKFSADYSQNKFPSSLSTTEMVMPPINYLANPEDGNGYGQVMNQNFNHSSYTYSPNTNIYPTTNFIAGISNTPSSYMMPLHENPPEYLETNSFLLPNVSNVPSTSKSAVNTSSSVSSSSTARPTSAAVSAPTNAKNHQQYNSGGKHQNCDKRNSYSTASKKSKRKADTTMNNLDFPIAGVTTPMDDYHSHHHHHHHSHASTFLPPPPHANPLYQNHPHPTSITIGATPNRRGAIGTGNSVAMAHHPSGTSLTNFNLSTIFPEINDKVTGYKPPNVIAPGLSQSSNHPATSYPQRANYAANNAIGHVPQVSEASHFPTDLPAPPPSALHYKAT